jgi:class 3 adenylate cyclase/pimeloyl-ACP methyl ester carboxylesterase
MTRRPETRYAWNGDVALAMQVFGSGPVDLVYLQGYVSHVDMNWESPDLARFLRGLGERARVIHTDRRGWGCSDRFSPGDVAPLEVQVDDLVAVMNEAGSERAVLFGSSETALTAMLFAALNPERTSGLVLVDAFVTFSATDETPWMYSEAQWEEVCDEVRRGWGRPGWDRFRDDREDEWFTRLARGAVAPGALVAETRAFFRADVRPVLSSIQAPTVVVTTTAGVAADSPENGRLIASRVRGARLLEMAPSPNEIGTMHWYGRAPAILDAVGELIASIRDEQASFDRVLATVLFTDIVDSTATAATMGDAKWKALIADHDRIARGVVARFRGTFVRGTGDGLLATFDGPARGVRCAQALAEAMAPLGLEIRAGLHTGEVEHGGSDLAGIAVHIGARVGAMAGPGEVWVSSTVKDLTAGSGLTFEDRGEHELKGVPDRWHLYRVTGG